MCLERASLDTWITKRRMLWAIVQFEGSGIHQSNTRLQITHHLYINGYFMLLFDLTFYRGASEGHTLIPENGNIRTEQLISKALPESITCLLYTEYYSTVPVNLARKVTTGF